MLKSKQTSLGDIKRSLLRSTPELQKLHAGILQISNYLPPSQNASHCKEISTSTNAPTQLTTSELEHTSSKAHRVRKGQ